MATYTKEEPPHRILREIFRHYLEFKEYFNQTGIHVIDHGYWIMDEEGHRRTAKLTFSLWDLQDSLKKLAPRKKEAIYYNVILDMKQKDVAEIMGITTVSVGQYVEQGFIQVAEDYFDEGDYVVE